MSTKQFLAGRWKATGMVHDQRVLQAFMDILRESFVPTEFQIMAYDDVPLPIGAEQTISQPTTIVLMLQALELQPADVVLEVGAGSGYTAALLSKLCKQVYTTEIIPSLSLSAGLQLKKLGITNVRVLNIDGGRGYKEKMPFDKILLNAGCEQIPQPLIDQLKEGGIILAPIGKDFQKMIKGKKSNGKLLTEYLGDFRFVPLTGKFK